MAVIRAGTAYEFNSAGRPLAVVYVEPNVASVEELAALVGETREVPGALIGMRGELSMIRALYEDPDSPRWVGSAIDDLVDFFERQVAAAYGSAHCARRRSAHFQR